MRRFLDLTRRFRKDERGAFAVIFALIAIVLIATSGAVVDFTRVQQARTRTQTALDSATLALQTQIKTQTTAQLKTKAQTILTERLNDATITATVDTVTVDTAAGKLRIEAHIVVPTAFVQMVGVPDVRANMQSEVTQNSNDLEVSVALDTTLSMAGTKIADLISATNTLIDLVVQTAQTPTYSKMAIVPWAYGVNVGAYADSVRGPVRGPWAISAAAWMSSQKTVSAVTKANPGIITTSTSHGFATNDYVYFSGISGMSQINNRIYQITVTSPTKFKLNVTASSWVNTTSYSTFNYNSGSGKVSKCVISTCEVRVTASGHDLTAGENVYITGVAGMTQLNGNYYVVGSPTATTFVLNGAIGPTYATYTSGGESNCILYDCKYYYFQAEDYSNQRYQINNCATERTTHQYDDASPATQLLTKNYTSGGSSCVAQEIQPLTSSKSTLHSLANSLTASGSTAGHLGLAWGWYMIAPNFASLWPTASQPKAYGSANLIKAVILMTDGAFNTQYCNGVMSKDSEIGGGSTHINCDAPNGLSKSQAESLCTEIKQPANHVILYTVGFQLGSDTTALNFLRDCATDPAHFYQADSGTDLTAAFKDIAQTLSELRLSK